MASSHATICQTSPKSSHVTASSSLTKRPAVPNIWPLCRWRAELMACAILCFDFIYSDFICWLGGEYTNDYWNWSDIFQVVDTMCNVPIPPGHPPIDIKQAIHISICGAPIAGKYECKFDDVTWRERYNNHPSLHDNLPAVRKKFEKEESQSYQIALPHFLWAFIFGLFISPITFVVRQQGKEGCICPNPSNKIHPTDTGAVNEQIPATGAEGAEDENLAVWYGTVLTQFLEWTWNLCIAQPSKEILGHVDDISTAYHHILYHPTIGIMYTQVFMEFLMIPVGYIFRGWSSPFWYMLPRELHAHMASVTDFSSATARLADWVKVPPPLTEKEHSRLAKAQADSIHQGDHHLQQLFHNSSFIDDNALAGWVDHICQVLHQSVLSAYVMFGFPDKDPQPPPFNDDKWEDLTNFLFKYLGYLIDTWKMIMIWPLKKCHQLASWLDDHWLASGIHSFSPLEASRLIRLLCHRGIISPLGIYLSLWVQYIINDYLSNHWFTTWGKLQRWWNTHKFPMLSEIQSELCILHHTIDDNIYHPAWCHSIGLIIQWEPTLIAKSDAAYEGIGGILDHLDCMWHVSGDDLWQLSWVLYGDEQELQQPLSDCRIYRILAWARRHSHQSPRVCHNFHQRVDDLEEDSSSLPRLPMDDIHCKVPHRQHICCFMAEIRWQVEQTTHQEPSTSSNHPIDSLMSISYPGHRRAHSRRDEWHHQCTFLLLQASIMGLAYC